ncbi:MAG: DbpA RNA binding domain-containing protein [Spirochaetaceae bacterium]|jgi:hypothetical protein|nr:DbpA RNA binding domain-containing protein [Spirochaetaceae bacterium]
MEKTFDADQTAELVKDILTKVYNEADLELLGKYLKTFKKEVPFSKRSYFAAWMLMEKGGALPRRQPAKPNNIPEDEATRLFFGAGRVRKVFPKEILAIILNRTTVSREDIGFIKIFDNYSFVEVRKTVADEIVTKLNGTPYRGRPITVNYARSRSSAPSEEFSLDDEPRESDDDILEEKN